MLSRDTLSRGLGALECLAGAALLVQGCRYSLADDGMTGMAGTFMVASALFALIVPGCLLFLRSPLRWLSQLPLALVVAWLGFSSVMRALGMR